MALTESSVPLRSPVPLRLTAAALLGASVAVGVAALFPPYVGGASLTAQPDQLALAIILLAGWAAAAALVGFGSVAAGAGLGAGVTIADLGVRAVDVGQAGVGGVGNTAGAGLWVGVAGWVLAAAGTAVAVVAAERQRGLGRPATHPWPLAAVAAAGAALTAGAYVPGWVTVRETIRALGRTVSVTNPNAFAEPWQLVVGSAVFVAVIAALPVLGVLWRPRSFGAGLLAGLLVMMVAQVVSTLVLGNGPPALSDYPVRPTPGEAHAFGVTARYVLNGWYDAEVEGVFILLVVWITLLLIPVQRHRGGPFPYPSEPSSSPTAATASR